MNVPDPRSSAQPARTSRRTCRRTTRSTSSTTARWRERLGVDLLIRAVARLRERIPGVRLHLWGHGDDLAGLSAPGRGARASTDSVALQAEGLPACRSCRAQLAPMDVGRRRQSAKRRLRSDAAGQAAGVRLARHSGRRAAAEDHRALLLRATWWRIYEPEDVESLADAIYRLLRTAERRRRRRPGGAVPRPSTAGSGRAPSLVNLYQRLLEN